MERRNGDHFIKEQTESIIFTMISINFWNQNLNADLSKAHHAMGKRTLCLTGFGLGHLLHYGRELHAMDQVIGVMLVIVLIGLLTDKILFAPIERFLHRRWGTGLR